MINHMLYAQFIVKICLNRMMLPIFEPQIQVSVRIGIVPKTPDDSF